MQWKSLRGKTGVLETRFALIPTYRLAPREMVLIDSGSELHPEHFEELAQYGMRVRAVLQTHLHPDHIANNHLLIERFGTEIYAAEREIQDVGPRFDLLRADPLEEKWLPSEPDYPIIPFPEGTQFQLDRAHFTLFPTPGHTAGHLSIVTPDGVCCMGDAVLSEETLDRSCLPYMEDDVDRALESMDELAHAGFPLYVAAHRAAVPAAALPALAGRNIRKELELYDLLRGVLTAPMELEDAVTAFMTAAGVRREIMLRRSSMRLSARLRLFGLARAGEYQISDGWISPCR